MSPCVLSRRDLLRLTCAAGCNLLLTACGAGKGSNANAVRIMVDSWALAYAPFKDMAKQYNALHPEAPVTIEASPGGWMTKVVAQIRSDELQWSAAGVMSTFADLAAWVQLGLIQPLDPFLEATDVVDANALLSDMLPRVLDDERLDGRMYGLPFSTENITYQWNTEWYRKAGITQAPTTWDELRTYCAAVKQVLDAEGAAKTYPLGFDLGHLSRNLGALFFSVSDQPYTEDGWYNWRSDEMRAALRFMREMSRAGLTPPNCGEGLEIVDMWTRGRLAGLYSPSSRGVWAQKQLGFDQVTTSQVPTADGGKHSGTTFWSNSISVFNNAPLPQQAVDFLLYACGPQNADWQKAIIQAGTSPAYASVYHGLLQDDES
ncbi:MAG: extracellular solute-binding protein, partial [Chloroflexi bacterium]|nr:extracellular solute-binding protein [Chloroflexota bacterium]